MGWLADVFFVVVAWITCVVEIAAPLLFFFIVLFTHDDACTSACIRSMCSHSVVLGPFFFFGTLAH